MKTTAVKKKKILVKESEYNKLQATGFLLLLFFSLALVVYTIWNYITPLIFGAIVAGAFYPFLDYLMRKFNLGRKTASLVVSGMLILLIFIPSIYFTVRLSREIVDLYESVQNSFSRETVSSVFFGKGYFADSMRDIFGFLNMKYTPTSLENLVVGGLKKISVSALNSINTVIGNVFSFLLQLILMIFVIYALFYHGPDLKNFLLNLSPLKNEDEEIILKKFNTMNYATLFYNGIGGLIQGVLAGAGFFLAGFDSIILWTSLMTVLAFIPLLGISFITVPAVIYLWINGNSVAAVSLFAYTTLVALLTENWFKPMFMGKHVEINSFLMFFSILGGMSAFGMAGIFYGPLIISVFFTISELYLNKYIIHFGKKQ